jgi:hypothetical protein
MLARSQPRSILCVVEVMSSLVVKMNPCSSHRVRHGTVLVCLKHNRLEHPFIDARNVSVPSEAQCALWNTHEIYKPCGQVCSRSRQAGDSL